MSYEHRCLMRRRLELYHDLLTEQLRPRIEAAAAAAAAAEDQDSDTDQYIDDDTDNTDDSDEDLCEWEHAKNKSSEEAYARVTQWRCGLERNEVCEPDATDRYGQTEERSDQEELTQQDNNNKACPIAEVHHSEHACSGNAADTSVHDFGGPLTPLLAALLSHPMTKTEEQLQTDDGETASSTFTATKLTASNIGLPDQVKPGSKSSKDDSADKFTTPPISPCRESSVASRPGSLKEGNHLTFLFQQTNLINKSQSTPTTSKLSQSPRRPESLLSRNSFPPQCPPTPPPDPSSSTSTYSSLRFTITPAQLKFFYKHIQQVEDMIRGIDNQFQMHEYQREVRRQNRRRRIRAEVEERMRFIERSNDMPGEDWSGAAGMDETKLVEESAEEARHHDWENSTVIAEWDSGGEGNQPANTKGESGDDPSSHEPGGMGNGCPRDGHGEEDDSVWVNGAGDENADAADGSSSDETGWDCSWSSTWLESKKKNQPHQPTKNSALRKGYTLDDMIWEEAVAEAEDLSMYGHHSKRDVRGRRYWRL